jgi:hypothetical protein
MTCANIIYRLKANFETDLAIAQKPNAVVISQDSDFFFHKNVVKFAKILPRGKTLKVLVFDNEKVKKHLKLSTDGMLMLGNLSGNDYSPNIKNTRITTVYKKIVGGKKNA